MSINMLNYIDKNKLELKADKRSNTKENLLFKNEI